VDVPLEVYYKMPVHINIKNMKLFILDQSCFLLAFNVFFFLYDFGMIIIWLCCRHISFFFACKYELIDVSSPEYICRS